MIKREDANNWRTNPKFLESQGYWKRHPEVARVAGLKGNETRRKLLGSHKLFSSFKGHNWGQCKKCGKSHRHVATKLLNEKNPFYGRRHTKESRLKMSESIKKRFAEINFKSPAKNPDIAKKISNTQRGKFKNGKLKIWCKGLTKETDERIKIRSEKISVKLKGHVVTGGTRKKISEKRLRQIIPKKDTEIENLLREELMNRGINFQSHYPVIGQPDIAIINNNKKIAIFCDGCYWHECPICGYGNKLEKDDKILKSLQIQNWVVLRFWEHEIKNNLDECVNKIEEVIS